MAASSFTACCLRDSDGVGNKIQEFPIKPIPTEESMKFQVPQITITGLNGKIIYDSALSKNQMFNENYYSWTVLDLKRDMEQGSNYLIDGHPSCLCELICGENDNPLQDDFKLKDCGFNDHPNIQLVKNYKTVVVWLHDKKFRQDLPFGFRSREYINNAFIQIPISSNMTLDELRKQIALYIGKEKKDQDMYYSNFNLESMFGRYSMKLGMGDQQVIGYINENRLHNNLCRLEVQAKTVITQCKYVPLNESNLAYRSSDEINSSSSIFSFPFTDWTDAVLIQVEGCFDKETVTDSLMRPQTLIYEDIKISDYQKYSKLSDLKNKK